MQFIYIACGGCNDEMEFQYLIYKHGGKFLITLKDFYYFVDQNILKVSIEEYYRS